MSAQNRQWILLDECITAYLNESEQSNHKYFKLWHLAYDAMTQLGLDVFYSVKSIKLPINANLTVTLPADYLQYVKIGVLNDKGEVIPLGVNSKLTTAYDLQSDRISRTQDPDSVSVYNPESVWWYNFWTGYSFTNLYGLPSGSPLIGSFKIDNENGVIVLNEHFSYDYIILEYVSSPQEGGEYYVPVQFKEAVIAYLRWKDIISLPNSRKGTLGDKQMRRADFYNERRLAIARYDPPRLPELYQALLENQRLSIKS